MSLLLRVVPEWLQLVSLACCIGVLVCSLWVLEPTRADSDRDDCLRGGMWQLLCISAGTLFATTILGLLVRSAEMSGQPVTALFSVLPVVLLHTHLGHAWVLRVTAVVTLLVAIIAGRSGSRSHLLQKIMLVCAVAASATNSASGHASDAGDFSVAEIVDWLHLLPTMVWGGGLLVLSAVILPRLEKLGAECSMAEVAARFSRIAALGVALIMLTALYEGWLYGSGVEVLWASRYGQTMLAKAVLFSFLLGLGAFNRYVSLPRLRESAGTPLDAPGLTPPERDARLLASARFVWSVQMEAVLVLVVLLCAAVLRNQHPPSHAVHHDHHAVVRDRVAP